MTKHTIDCLKGTVCSASPNHGLTALEIQRWEDDGGAIFTSCVRRRQRCDRHVHDAPGELAPAAKTDVSEMVDRVAAGEEIVIAKAAGRSIGMQTHKVTAGSPGDLDAAFATIGRLSVDAFTVGADGFFITRREQFAALAAQYGIPGIYPFPDFPASGGLLSYGLDLEDAYRQAGVYAGRILKGANPADLPVMQPTKFQLVINLKTAKALGLTVPQSILVRADEVIE